jgi:hypothetical protein
MIARCAKRALVGGNEERCDQQAHCGKRAHGVRGRDGIGMADGAWKDNAESGGGECAMSAAMIALRTVERAGIGRWVP